MSSDPPKPDNREEFIEWMVGRDFKFDRGPDEDPMYIHVADWTEDTTSVPEGISPGDLQNVSTNTVFLRYTELEDGERVVEGEYITAYITLIHPPADPSDVSQTPFDSVRIAYMKGRLNEI